MYVSQFSPASYTLFCLTVLIFFFFLYKRVFIQSRPEMMHLVLNVTAWYFFFSSNTLLLLTVTIHIIRMQLPQNEFELILICMGLKLYIYIYINYKALRNSKFHNSWVVLKTPVIFLNSIYCLNMIVLIKP